MPRLVSTTSAPTSHGTTVLAEPESIASPSDAETAPVPLRRHAENDLRFLEIRDADAAWDAFLDRFAPIVLQVVHLFERDADRIDDCFLFAIERLRRDALRRLRAYRAGGAASFATWLRAVVRNLCLDWRRARFGRPRLPRAVARLSRLDQEVFRAVLVRGLSENEALHTLRPLCPTIDRRLLDESLARVRRSLDGRQTWSLLVRRPREISLSARAESDRASLPLDPPDPRPGPADEAETRETLAALGGALARRAPRERLLIRLHYEQGLSFEEIARLPGLGPASVAAHSLRQALDALRADLSRAERTELSV